MPTFYGIDRYRRHVAGRMQRSESALVRWREESAESARGMADDQLSGGIKSKELARRGHPFARRHYTASMKRRKGSRMIATPLLPINQQSSRLREGLGVQDRRNQSWVTIQGAPHARYVLAKDGTTTMRPRRFAERTKRDRATIRERELRRLRRRLSSIHAS